MKHHKRTQRRFCPGWILNGTVLCRRGCYGVGVFTYSLFLLFKQIFLGQKEKRQQFKTLRYKYFVLPAQMGKTGRDAALRISVMNKKIRAKLSYLFTRISQYIPDSNLNCSAFEKQ